jgi:hypothetical protein
MLAVGLDVAPGARIDPAPPYFGRRADKSGWALFLRLDNGIKKALVSAEKNFPLRLERLLHVALTQTIVPQSGRCLRLGMRISRRR